MLTKSKILTACVSSLLILLLIVPAAYAEQVFNGEWICDNECTLYSGMDYRPDTSPIARRNSGKLEHYISDGSVITRNGRTLHAETVDEEKIIYYTAVCGSQSLCWKIRVLPTVEYFDIQINGQDFYGNAILIDKDQIGTSFDLTAYARPDASQASCVWSSNNDRILAITGDGRAAIQGKGECILSVRASDGHLQKLRCVVGDVSDLKYFLEIDKTNQVVRVFTKDTNGIYSILVRRMICSSGNNRHILTDGIYRVPGPRRRWMGTVLPGIYVQYGTQLWEGVYFHSIPYTKNGNGAAMETKEYKGLGSNISDGCIRLLCADCKWIYENITAGTYTACTRGDRKESEYGSVTLPELSVSEYLTWDPTDDDPENPYYDPTYTSLVQ